MRKLVILFFIFLILALSFARGGGGCFLPGTEIQTAENTVTIENVKLGQSILGFYDNSTIVNTTITEIYEVERSYYYVIETTNGQVKATAEHPFYVGNSEFKEVEDLVLGDTIYTISKNALQPTKILRITRVDEPIKAYNLQVEGPHTFFANTFAVHNKGCFLPGTLISSPSGENRIEDVKIGDMIYSFDDAGNVKISNVTGMYKVSREEYYTVSTRNKEVNATAEHPFYTQRGYVSTRDLHVGDEVFIYQNNAIAKEKILSIKTISANVTAYNLEVDNTHTFFANGFAVHNKGGCFQGDTQIACIVNCVGGSKPISVLTPGDEILSFDDKGQIAQSKVLEIYSLEANEYYELSTKSFVVNVTAEHPFYTDEGYIEVQNLHTGDEVYVLTNNSLVKQKIIAKVLIQKPLQVYNLHVDNTNTFFGNNFAVHNKGCFLSGTNILTEAGSKKIEQVSIDDIVYSFDESGRISKSKVLEVYEVTRDYYYSIRTDSGEVNATAEHPFYTDVGYVEAGQLAVGDQVYLFNGAGIDKEKITSIIKTEKQTKAYNLQVDGYHTFFANGFAVHNKGGGGGGSYSSGPPSNVFYYNCKNSYNDSGTIKTCCRQASSIYTSTSPTTLSPSRVKNSAYPYCVCTTTQCKCTNDPKYPAQTGSSLTLPVCPISPIESAVGLIIGIVIFAFDNICITAFLVLIIYSFIHPSKRRTNSEWSSTIDVPKSKVIAKAKKISTLLFLWGKADQAWDEELLEKTAKSTFLKLQSCWSARDYTEMQSLMMPSLYNQHVAQLNAMKARHEINKMDNVKLLDAQLVLVKNYHNTAKDEFTIWVSAQAKDTIVDDRTGNQIRGDSGTGQFQEFWTFQRQGDMWKLRQIDQPEEGMSVIDKENYDEISTQMGMEQIYQKAGGPKIKDLKAGAVREQDIASDAVIGTIKWKSDRVHRLLNFLVESDKIWKEPDMVDVARTFFIELNTSIEERDISSVRGKLTPDFCKILIMNTNQMIASHQVVQKRNLAVRNVEIVLVRNFYNRTKDEFTAWISGQSQQVVVDEKTEQMLSGDTAVLDFEEFWTFQRQENDWLLKSIDKGFKAKDFVNQENYDEGTTDTMLQWYYTKDRTV